MIRSLKSDKDTLVLRCVGCALIIAFVSIGQAQQIKLKQSVRTASSLIQEEDEKPRHPESARAISAATMEFQKAVSRKASVLNRCLVQGNEKEIEEKSDVLEIDRCQLVVRTTKTTSAGAPPNQSAAKPEQSVEFRIYADLSKLTTPVLVEPQKFAQCEAGAGVLKVSSRSDPAEPIRVIRQSQNRVSEAGEKLTRKDLSLFFADPKAAKKAANALDRAIKACGGKQWPDEDDLP